MQQNIIQQKQTIYMAEFKYIFVFSNNFRQALSLLYFYFPDAFEWCFNFFSIPGLE